MTKWDHVFIFSAEYVEKKHPKMFWDDTKSQNDCLVFHLYFPDPSFPSLGPYSSSACSGRSSLLHPSFVDSLLFAHSFFYTLYPSIFSIIVLVSFPLWSGLFLSFSHLFLFLIFYLCSSFFLQLWMCESLKCSMVVSAAASLLSSVLHTCTHVHTRALPQMLQQMLHIPQAEAENASDVHVDVFI